MACGVWDGTDFTSCFRDRYLANTPPVLAGVAVLVLLFQLFRSRGIENVTTAQLVPPGGDDLVKLEARVLLSAVAGTLKPPIPASVPDDVETAQGSSAASIATTPSTRRAAVAPTPAQVQREAEGAINAFRRDKPASARRWERTYWIVGLSGAAILLGLCVFFAYRKGLSSDWNDLRPLAFPAALFLLAFTRDAPLAPLVTFHLMPEVLLFRSEAISPNRSAGPLIVLIAEVVYWAALISIPYYDWLDQLLAGGVSHGGANVAKGLKRHIEEPTSAFSRATYWFILPFLWKHYWTPITLEDIPAIREDDGAAASLGAFRAFQANRDARYEDRYSTPRKRDLGIDLLRFFSPLIFWQCLFACSFIVLQYLPPTGLRLLLKYIKDGETSEQPKHVAVLYIAMMAVGQSLGIVVYGQSLMLGRRVCIRMRAIITAEVFAKALRREDRSGAVKSSKAGAEDAPESSSEGKVSNLVAVDAFMISEVCAYIFYLVSCPFAIVVNLTLLHITLGTAAYAGVAMLLLLIPVQAIMGRLFTIFQQRLMTATDKRLDVVTEVISFIKLIKYNSWQSKFFDRMAVTRKAELRALAQRFGLITFYNTIVWGTPTLVTSAAFGVHVLVLKQPLTADRAFASLLLFNMLRDPLALMQDTITRLLQAYTSCCRIGDFLDEPETLKYKQISVPGPSDPTIGFHDALFVFPGQEADAACGEGAEIFRLGELDLSFPAGELTLVTGPVGSGKTMLILSLLGETVLLKGKVFIPNDMASRDLLPVDPTTGLADTIAYCAQTPWLVGATIRENIVFGSIWDQARYDAVVDACALRRDFEIFDLGDNTEVGEKGTTCSGGQKARIALARAIYSPAKTVILDDVLSAVDAQTARHIYKHVLQGSLMQGRSCILVTHAVSLCLPAASFVVMLDAGQCVASGTPAELIASGLVSDGSGTPTEERSATSIASDGTPTIVDDIEKNLDGKDREALLAQKIHDAEAAGDGVIPDTEGSKQLVQEESSNQGSIGLATYMLYFKALGGFWYWTILIISLLGTQYLQYLTNWWVREWSKAPAKKQLTMLGLWSRQLHEEHTAMYNMGVYVILSAIYLVGTTARVGISFVGSLRASSRLYKRMLKHLLGAKLRFFDSTPSGRIMNRLSKDMSSIDQETTEILTYFINCVLMCAAVIVVVGSTTPAFLYAVPGITLLYWAVGTLYVTTSREIKRFDSVTRSPIFVSFSEALVGMSTIRSYGDGARFLNKLIGEIDTNTRCFWYLWQTNRILNNLSNFVGTIITVFAAVLALSTSADAGTAGLSITYALSFTEYVLWVVRLYASAEMSMNSVERVAEYLDLEQEEPEGLKTVEPPAYWPSRDGSIIVKDLTCKYAPQLDPVLRKVSFEIAPREKIGVCGRTGSGKSTLALSFFRFLYQEGGEIEIDGIDISKLSLDTLRSRLTILPQEAQLFSGSVRDNMDPFAQHEDMEIWEVLRQVGLTGRTPGASVAASRAASRPISRVGSTTDVTEVEERVMIRSLDENVATGGKNFSQGQRQLLALARGLLKLRDSSFLIMDESTANLDNATDATIQNVLRTGLADTQMVVIAHRLMTVCGLDKILVLDHGKVIEFGTPWELLQDEHGSFRDLCRQSGEEAQLFELARSVHNRKTSS